MLDEMVALHSNHTWSFVPSPLGKSILRCCWVFIVKVGLDGQVDQSKACLVAKSYIQIFGFNYGDTFLLVAKMAYVRLFLSMAAGNHGPLYQLDIKNVFLNGKSEEEVYMEQLSGFVV